MDTDFLLEEIEKYLDDLKIGFCLSPRDQALLENPELASKSRIVELEEKLPVSVRNDLFHIANSPFYRKPGMQAATDFWEVSEILGLQNMKSFIFNSALFGVSSGNKDIQDLKNRCLATTGLSLAIVHNVLGYDRNLTPKVQLCALVSEFGKIPLYLYRQQQAGNHVVAKIMTEDFIAIHHGKFGLKMIEKYRLPDFLKDLFEKRTLIFFDGPHELSITTVVRMAKLLVRESFKHAGKLVLTSVVDDPKGIIFNSVGTEIQTFFDSLGIKHLLDIIPHETPSQHYAAQKQAHKP